MEEDTETLSDTERLLWLVGKQQLTQQPAVGEPKKVFTTIAIGNSESLVINKSKDQADLARSVCPTALVIA